jgi:hypothetical protein
MVFAGFGKLRPFLQASELWRKKSETRDDVQRLKNLSWQKWLKIRIIQAQITSNNFLWARVILRQAMPTVDETPLRL